MLKRRLVINGEEFCLAAGQCGKGAPTKDTEGCVGITYMDTDTKQMYICTKCENDVYTWEPFAAGSSSGNDAYIFTGIREDRGNGQYHVILNDDYSWETLTSAAYDHKYIGCVLWDDNREYPVYLTLGAGYFGDGYAVFTALDEYGYAWEMHTYKTGATLRYYDIRGGKSDAAGAAFYTELTRQIEGSISLVRVVCHGLTEGETYELHLYTASRRKGCRQDPWRHPSNENTGEGYTGKGYANLSGRIYDSSDTGVYYPAVPDWMPNNGILQTEWEFTATAETETIEIDLGTWLLPMLKPIEADFDNDAYGLIGVTNSAIAPLLFQFRLAKNGTVGECRNTLRVGLRMGSETDDYDGSVTYFPRKISLNGSYRIMSNQLYTSIR